MSDSKFWVFGMERYETDGGLNDLQAIKDTLEDAQSIVIGNPNNFYYWEIYEINGNVPVNCWYRGEVGEWLTTELLVAPYIKHTFKSVELTDFETRILSVLANTHHISYPDLRDTIKGEGLNVALERLQKYHFVTTTYNEINGYNVYYATNAGYEYIKEMQE